MDFLIFRHGETYVSKHNLPNYGDTENTAGLLPEGVPAIRELGLYLKKTNTDINLTSPLKRCLETVEIVTEISGKKFTIDDRLGEYDPDMENKLGLIERIKGFMDEIAKKDYRSVLICTHGYPISAILQYLSEGKVEVPKLDNYPNPGVLTIVKDGKISEIDFDSKKESENKEE